MFYQHVAMSDLKELHSFFWGEVACDLSSFERYDNEIPVSLSHRPSSTSSTASTITADSGSNLTSAQ